MTTTPVTTFDTTACAGCDAGGAPGDPPGDPCRGCPDSPTWRPPQLGAAGELCPCCRHPIVAVRPCPELQAIVTVRAGGLDCCSHLEGGLLTTEAQQDQADTTARWITATALDAQAEQLERRAAELRWSAAWRAADLRWSAAELRQAHRGWQPLGRLST